MTFNIGDLVTRFSYNHDTVFKIKEINNNIAYLKGVNVRLCADSEIADLKKYDKKEEEEKDDDNYDDTIKDFINLDRESFFYLPGKVLHIDSDKDYLDRCLKFYKKSNVMAYGIHIGEEDATKNITKYLQDTNPDIVVITGHDALYKKQDKNNLNSYKNSSNFIKSIKAARKYEKSPDKLIIIAGACQSDYEELIKAGATFASSPKRINIHALDPAIIASMICLSDKSEDIDLLNILEKTKYGSNGMGGLKTKGMMYVGYPR